MVVNLILTSKQQHSYIELVHWCIELIKNVYIRSRKLLFHVRPIQDQEMLPQSTQIVFQVKHYALFSFTVKISGK